MGLSPQRMTQLRQRRRSSRCRQKSESPIVVLKSRKSGWSEGGAVVLKESEAKRERDDGPKGITTPALPETVTGVRKLQRTL